MKYINNMGPNMLPCGTPLVILLHADLESLILTKCVLQDKKSLIHFNRLPVMPYLLSLKRRRSWGTESKAFLKSMYAMSIGAPESRLFCQSLRVTRSWELVERPGTNPYWWGDRRFLDMRC